VRGIRWFCKTEKERIKEIRENMVHDNFVELTIISEDEAEIKKCKKRRLK
jgi:hypothetical protein